MASATGGGANKYLGEGGRCVISAIELDDRYWILGGRGDDIGERFA